MTTIVAGATGATGRLLVAQLLDRGQHVKAIVRSPENLPESIKSHPNLSVIEASLLELSGDELAEIVEGCSAAASCLGHPLSFSGIFGQPRRLVTEATRRLCDALAENHSGPPAKFVLMNTSGNRNRDLDEPIPVAQQIVIGLLRICIPPHADNEEAADYLRTHLGQNDNAVEWVAVRPDTLIDEEAATEYTVHASPTRSAIFNAGRTSRVNVSHFMAELISNPEVWDRWRGRMPVIYNKS